jgi:3-dehydrosphinganine reductase
LSDLPSILFCVAGGAADEMGFFVDLKPDQLCACFIKNYFSAAFITQSLMRRWVKQPDLSQPSPRHIVLTGSTAAFVALPGYGAYTPTKTALRALADTIRQEALMYPRDIRVHCSFPGTIFTDTFYEEQKSKPTLTKKLEGSDNPKDGMTAEAVATATIAGLRRDEFLIPPDFQTKLLLNNMRGPSPPNHALLDWLFGFLVSLVWPFIRMSMDRQTKAYKPGPK